MKSSVIAAAGLVAIAQAFTPPVQPPTYGALLTPSGDSPVTTGQDYTITWSPKQPADGVTVSFVLCNGPGSNCVLQSSAIAEGVPAASGSYTWSVPCSLPEGVASTETGYGMLIIVDGTGEFQYSTQFSVNKGDSCSASSPTTSSSTTTTSSSSSSYGPPFSFNSSTTLVTTTSVPYTFPPSSTTSHPAETTGYSHSAYSTSGAPAAATTSATPKPFTGGAAAPSALLNVAGFVGAAALAVFAF